MAFEKKISNRNMSKVLNDYIILITKNKKTAKRLANEYDYFLSEVPHMGLVGRFLGVVLGPRGKMPRPVPPTVDPSAIAAGLRNTVVVRSRDKMTFHVAIGTVKQSEDQLMENVMTVYNRVTSKLERGIGNIRSLYIKKVTMATSKFISIAAVLERGGYVP